MSECSGSMVRSGFVFRAVAFSFTSPWFWSYRTRLASQAAQEKALRERPCPTCSQLSFCFGWLSSTCTSRSVIPQKWVKNLLGAKHCSRNWRQVWTKWTWSCSHEICVLVDCGNQHLRWPQGWLLSLSYTHRNDGGDFWGKVVKTLCHLSCSLLNPSFQGNQVALPQGPHSEELRPPANSHVWAPS